ncbi:radical SAM protein [Thalassobaculum sp.]|uniref:B12-binding domain-containing radical SAM protein n=1 Tax=Thalassobaculum sp. TaxID=2022740 RepID=UPI0032EEAC25
MNAFVMQTYAKTRVGMVQINNSFSGQSYLPYSVAVLESYARKHLVDPDRFEFVLPIYARAPIAQSVDQLAECDVVGFSVYVWNFEISLEIARRLRRVRPQVLILFGGPHVPDAGLTFLAEHKFIDIAVHGEGEKTFTEILDHVDDQDWSSIAGLTYRGVDGQPTRNRPRERFRSLNDVPSPFLDGTFERLMSARPDETWIGLWETNRGCPFRCTFCDWGSATGDKVSVFEENRLRREIDWFAEHQIEFIFCCDANFGIKKRDVDLAEYVAEVKRMTGYPSALSVQNTKNATERAYRTQKILSDAGLNKGVALSMQSLDQNTLKHIKRDNISLDTYFELQKRFTEDRVETYSDLILGMPGETYDSFVGGTIQLIENGQHNRIQFNNLSILPNAEMADPEYRARHGTETVRSRIINIHGVRTNLEDDVPEFQELVVATSTMPPYDWRRTRIFCWTVALLHFDKLFQIPIALANALGGVGYREVFEAFMDVDAGKYPILASIQAFFEDEARSIQGGGNEYHFAEEWLGIYWPQDELVFIRLATDGRVEAFNSEANQLLKEVLRRRGTRVPDGLIDDAIELNSALIKRPGPVNDVVVRTRFDILSFYDEWRLGRPTELRSVPTDVRVDRATAQYLDLQQWCREVVWWGNKKGAYLYSGSSHEKQLAGHF